MITQLSSGNRDLWLGLSLYLHHFFVCMSSSGECRPLVKRVYQIINFLISQPKHMLCNVGTQKNHLNEQPKHM